MGSKRTRTTAVVEILDEDEDAGASSEVCREREGKAYLKRLDEIRRVAGTESARGIASVSKEEFEKLVGDVMRHVIFKAGQQSSQPITRESLSGIVTKRYPRKAGLPQAILAEAQASFARTWGMEMRELVRTKATGEATTQKYFILRSLLPKRFRDGIKGREREELENKEEKGLLLVVLMMVSLSGDEMVEESLWQHLNLLGLEKGKRHKVFGDPGSALAKFVRQRYLTKVTKKSDSGRVIFYQPGENALDEIDQVDLNDAISKILQKGTNVEEVIELD
ncbi:MAGE domain-containing protein [Chloropicon primus]|uniref:MAGE domain-containing protein n=1 Tax=Chloropicon primus TaxID=1764295 RepID=A0A5B8MF39_9CHLO|nr:MAGE domain-containing protein [Chloropicon primus]|eukprot:QDZ17890.1 MAGE domain-containing protein [Chloropicon primus]